MTKEMKANIKREINAIKDEIYYSKSIINIISRGVTEFTESQIKEINVQKEKINKLELRIKEKELYI